MAFLRSSLSRSSGPFDSGKVSLPTGSPGRCMGSASWQAAVADWALAQPGERPADSSLLGIRWRVSSKTPRKGPQFISEVWARPPANGEAAWQSSGTERGRTLTAGPPAGRRVASLPFHSVFPAPEPLCPPPAGWVRTAAVSLANISAIMRSVRKGLKLAGSAWGRCSSWAARRAELSPRLT